MRLSSKYTFILGLLIICLSGVAILLDHPGFALRLISYAFWILALATVQYIWEVKNER